MNIETAAIDIKEKGFLDITPDPTLDLFAEIEKLKTEKNAIILAHYYQESDIQDIADYIGDSLGLAQQAEKTNADIIVFARVHFMAETAAVLSPNKMVLLPDMAAGCSLAATIDGDQLRAWKAEHPGRSRQTDESWDWHYWSFPKTKLLKPART